MPRTRTLFIAALTAGAFVLGSRELAGRVDNAAATGKSDQYCWGKMAPASADSDRNPILSESCFDNEEDALSFGSADAVYTHLTI